MIAIGTQEEVQEFLGQGRRFLPKEAERKRLDLAVLVHEDESTLGALLETQMDSLMTYHNLIEALISA